MENVKKVIQENWNQHAGTYDQQYLHGLKSPEEKDAWLCLLKELVGQKPCRILDVGTGTGFLALMLTELGHTCKGVDLSPGMLAQARQKAADAGLSIDFAIGDAEALDEPDGQYDVVINRHILWTMPHPNRAVREWVRVLKPGGRLVVIDGDWFFDSFHNNVQIFWGKLLTLCSGGENLFRREHSTVKDHLPMTRPENARRAPQLLENAGLTTTVRDAGQVTKAERAAMPLRERLLNPHKRIIMIGQKPEHPDKYTENKRREQK